MLTLVTAHLVADSVQLQWQEALYVISRKIIILKRAKKALLEIERQSFYVVHDQKLAWGRGYSLLVRGFISNTPTPAVI